MAPQKQAERTNERVVLPVCIDWFTHISQEGKEEERQTLKSISDA